MNKVITKLQVPINLDLKVQAEKMANDEGYSSLQEFVRVVITGFVRGKIKPSFNIDNSVEYIDPEYERYLNKRLDKTLKAIQKGTAYTVTSGEELVDLALKSLK